MNLKEYNRLTDLFGKLNSRENTEDEFAAMSEGEKLKFFWKDCMPEKIDASSIIEKTQQKIKRDAMRRRRNYFLVASASIGFCSDLYFNYILPEPDRRGKAEFSGNGRADGELGNR